LGILVLGTVAGSERPTRVKVMPDVDVLSLGLRGILVLDLTNGISGFAKSNEHSLGEMNTFLVTFRDLVPRRAVPRAGMINESGFDGACYDDKGVF
jgi:hypothetical protein